MHAVVKRRFDKCLLRPEELTPTGGFRVVGAFNPGACEYGKRVLLLVRVAEMPLEKRCGYTALPVASEGGNLAVEWHKDEDVEIIDGRLVRLKSSGLLRLTNISHLRLVWSDGFTVGSFENLSAIYPSTPYEEYGIEDPRITQVGETFFITYVAVSRHGVVTALISTDDFISFKRHGIIFPTDNKDVVIFPEKINGAFVAFHRPLSAAPFSPPEVWVSESPDAIHWGKHRCAISGYSDEDFMKIGAGTPPIKTPKGWLEIYHSSHRASAKDTVGAYCGRAALFSLEDPTRLTAVSSGPVLVPETDYDKKGFLPNIVFPSGIVSRDDSLLVYYGAADTFTAVAILSLDDVLRSVV